MTIERPMFPPRAESVDSFSHQPPVRHRPDEGPISESPKPAEGLFRRHMLTGLATLPVALPAAAATEPDPIFALIEAKRAADIAHLASLGALNEAARGYGIGSDEEQAAYDDSELPCHAAFDAAWSLASTPPSTLAGVLAMLKFVKEIDDQGQWPEDMGLEQQLLASTATAIETIIRQGGAA
jgi:hypothetical protein